MRFSEAIQRQIDGEIVRVYRLAEFRFKSKTLRLWPGQYVFTDGDGNRWEPTYGIGQVTGISQASAGTAPELQFEMSGVDPEFIRLAQASVEEYYGRIVRVLLQFVGKAGEPLGDPYVFTWGLMKSLISRRQAVENGTMSTLVLTAESPFDGRARARNSYLSDRDQQTRSPGDLICSRIAGIEAKEVVFPAF